MSHTLPQVSTDSRPAMARLRRVQLYQELNAHGIPYPVGATKDQMLKLLEANGIDLNTPAKSVEWFDVHGKDENGLPTVERYPKQVQHESARLQANGNLIDYDSVIQERAKATQRADEAEQKVKEQNLALSEQTEFIRQMAARLEQLESSTLPLAKMTPPQLKSIAKKRGIDTRDLKTKKQLLEVLEA